MRRPAVVLCSELAREVLEGGMHAESLSLADAVRFHMSTPQNPLEIAVLLMLGDRMEPRALERLVVERLAPHERFRQTVAKAPFPLRPSWRPEPEFDVLAHVRPHSEATLSDEALAALVAERLSHPLSFDRSPWQMEQLPLERGKSALLFRVHHCVADGLSLVRLLCELADEPRPTAPRHTPSSPGRARSTLPARQRAMNKVRALAGTLLRVTAASPDTARELHGPSGRKSVAWSAPLDLNALTQAASEHGHHVTELLLAATADALTRGLRATGREVPPTMRALVPFGASLGRRELGNHFASTFVDLVLDEPDVWRRIERMSEHTRKLHDPTQAGAARTLIGLAGWLSPPLMRGALNFFSQRASVVLSNVPGPSEPVRLLGHPVNSIVVFAPPSSSIGLSFTLFGYAGELRLGVQLDDTLPLSAQQLVTEFEAVMHDMCRASRAS